MLKNSDNPITLKDILVKILEFESVYFNDEGEHWDLPTEHNDYYMRYVLGYSSEEYQAQLARKQMIVDFFSGAENVHETQSIREFMIKTGMTGLHPYDRTDIVRRALESCSGQI